MPTEDPTVLKFIVNLMTGGAAGFSVTDALALLELGVPPDLHQQDAASAHQVRLVSTRPTPTFQYSVQKSDSTLVWKSQTNDAFSISIAYAVGQQAAASAVQRRLLYLPGEGDAT